MKKTTVAPLSTAMTLVAGLATTPATADELTGERNACDSIYDSVINENDTPVSVDNLSACEKSFHDRVGSYVLKFGKYQETLHMLNLAECGRFGPLGDPNALASIFKTPQEQASKTADDGWTCLKVAGDKHVQHFSAMGIDGRKYYQTLTDAYCIVAASQTKSGQAQETEVNSCKYGLRQLGIR